LGESKPNLRRRFPSLADIAWLPLCLLLILCAGCATVPYTPPSVSAPAQPLPGIGIYHNIARGDTLWRISKTYGVELVDIIRANHISDAATINPGDRIFIPGVRAPLQLPERSARLYESDVFLWPVEGTILSYFGQDRYGARNKGIDIEARKDTSVIASQDGKVVFCNDAVLGLGRVIIIDHLNGFSTVYARNEKILVKIGDPVNRGQAIATVGSGGRGGETCLHFEIRRGFKPYNPLYYLP